MRNQSNMEYRQEINKLVRFVVVGTSTFALQTALYYVLSRWLLTALPHTLDYVVALLYSLVFNYSVNRAWTFRDQTAARGSVKRYAVVSATASAMCAVFFWLGHDVLGFYDLYVVVVVNLLIPFYTFAAHRFYTFHDEPGQVIRRFVRSSAH